MRLIIVFLVGAIFYSCSDSSNGTDLLNGEDLNWDTFIGPDYDTTRKKFDTIPGAGLNNDPTKVFSVIEMDGKQTLRISGEKFGGISTREEFSNYHLTVQFKWGKDKYAPKLGSKRDSGLLYHGTGEHGLGDGFWLRSQEFQVQEGDCGDYWGVAGAAFDVPVSRHGGEYYYDPAGELMTFSEISVVGRHAVKNPDAEKPYGKWNVLELYCLGDSAVHVVNGKVVMRLYNSNLKKGKIQFQSEGAEVFYRDIRIEKITRIPDLTF